MYIHGLEVWTMILQDDIGGYIDIDFLEGK
jgi:hypothetical protein